MKRIYSFLLLILCCFPAVAQQENVWVFGDKGGIDFNGGSPVAFTGAHEFTEACAAVCNDNGQLQFSTNGNTVWDRNHVTMPNGATLITDISYPPFGPTASTSQGALIVPMPDSAGKYYIFSLTSLELGGNSGRLYYSVVNMALNGGLGDIEPGRKGILLDSMFTEHLAATVGDRCNVWVVVTAHQTTTWKFKAFDVSGAGINPVPVVSSFTIPVSPSSNYGTMNISPSGEKLALVWAVAFSAIGGQELYDFSPSTGIVSNRIVLDATIGGGYGICFSPDNSKLYVTDTGLAQYDLSLGSAAAIIASKTYLGFTSGGVIKRGPGGKLYLPANLGLSTVNAPNLAGTASNFTPNSIPLAAGTSGIFSLPNVVPIIQRDTVHTSQTAKPPCFTTELALQAVNNATGWGYLWSNGNVGPATMVSSPGTYWLSYHEPPCTYHVDTFKVSFESYLPALTAFAGCVNDSNALVRAAPFPGDTLTYSYTWRQGASILRGPLLSNHGDTLTLILNNATYSLQITAPNGCDTILEVTTPSPAYHAVFSASDSIICMGDPVTFQNLSQGGFATYQWDFADGSGSTVENPVHTFVHPGSYNVRLVAATSHPCYDTAYKRIAVDSLLPGSFITDHDSICTGQSITFYPQTDSTTLSLSWSFGDGTGMASPNETVQHAYDNDGVLPVQLTGRFRACPDVSYTDSVYVYPLPLVSLGPDSGLCLHGAPILLRNQRSAPAGAYTSLWSTGDTSESITVVHPGTYKLTLSAAPLGCSTTETVTIHKDCYIDIPNAFTPNSDGVNDYFFPRQLLSRKVTWFKMQLFNRWGQVVFETQRVDGRGWDGKLNSQEQPQGVYVYLIEVEIDGAHKEQYQGNVTLIR